MVNLITMETAIVKVPLRILHMEHEIWSKEFLFFQDELTILNKYLVEVATKNTSKDVLREVEHFQNQFIRQKEVLDGLKHDIRLSEKQLVSLLKSLSEKQIEHLYVEDQEELRDAVVTYKKIYADLKTEFLNFIAKWL